MRPDAIVAGAEQPVAAASIEGQPGDGLAAHAGSQHPVPRPIVAAKYLAGCIGGQHRLADTRVYQQRAHEAGRAWQLGSVPGGTAVGAGEHQFASTGVDQPGPVAANRQRADLCQRRQASCQGPVCPAVSAQPNARAAAGNQQRRIARTSTQQKSLRPGQLGRQRPGHDPGLPGILAGPQRLLPGSGQPAVGAIGQRPQLAGVGRTCRLCQRLPTVAVITAGEDPHHIGLFDKRDQVPGGALRCDPVHQLCPAQPYVRQFCIDALEGSAAIETAQQEAAGQLGVKHAARAGGGRLKAFDRLAAQSHRRVASRTRPDQRQCHQRQEKDQHSQRQLGRPLTVPVWRGSRCG